MHYNYKLPEATNEKHSEPVKDDKRLIKTVTFFGDSAIPEGDPIYESVWSAAQFLAKNDYAIVNGGGPGIMKAATDGAESVDGKTVAIYWQPKLASFFEGKNLANVTDESETFSNYLIRTLGLIEYGDAYVVCKGGTGTISEFGMVWALAKLYYGCHKPVILYGEFWDEIIESFQKNMYIDEIEAGVLYQANSPEQILELLQKHEQKIAHCNGRKFNGDEAGFVLGSETKTTVSSYNAEASSYHAQHAGRLVAQDQLDHFMQLVHPPAKVLDVGSGAGHDTAYLSSKYSVTGVEISEKFAQIARFEHPEIEFINADITTHDLGTNVYKGIWARNSLHHIPERDMDKVFSKLSNALVEGGYLYMIVREGEGEHIETDIKNYLKIEKFYHLFSEQEIRNRAELAGMNVISIERNQRSHKWIIAVLQKK